MRAIVFFLLLIGHLSIYGQTKFSVKEGEIDFTSNAKLELIKAQSKNLQGVINSANNQFAFLVKVQSFEGFNSKLQKDHFNEKYMETDKYYDATFTGKIVETIDFTKDGEYDVKANGNLTIHGKKQPRIISAKIKIIVVSFILKPPSILRKGIAGKKRNRGTENIINPPPTIIFQLCFFIYIYFII